MVSNNVTQWDTIVDRLHEESGLQYPDNILHKIIGACVTGLFEENVMNFLESLIYECFLLSSQGKYLDILGEEYGVDRETNEDDDNYRKRIFNIISYNLTVNYLKRQGLLLYNLINIENNPRYGMTSHNPYMSNYFLALPETQLARDFMLNDMIYEYVLKYYIKGWD